LPGRATLTPEAREILRDVASQLVENPQYKVQCPVTRMFGAPER
jgi:outer membrane protein OmpA-like peptidoglycan-associated protein